MEITKIVNHIINNKIPNYNLLRGGMGVCVFLYTYCHKMNDKKVEDFADTLLDDIIKNINTIKPVSFECGLSGVGWGIEYLFKNNFCLGDIDEILEDIDTAVFKEINGQKKMPIDLQNGLLGYLLYLNSRLENKNLTNPIYKVNVELLKKVVNLIDVLVPDIFIRMTKDYGVDFFWPFPIMFYALKKTLQLNIYNEKIINMINQWMYNINTHIPVLHSNRLSLAITLKEINNFLKKKDMEKQIKNILFSIDFDILKSELNFKNNGIQFSWMSVVFLLNQANLLFDEKFPNYSSFETSRREIISMQKCYQSNNPMILEDDTSLGLCDGLCGSGILYLLTPEAFQ